METCEALTKKNKTPCCRPAGWGTDHFGEGKCKLHGGASPIKHGLYSKYLRGIRKELYEEFLNSTEIDDLSSEVARLRAILSEIDKEDQSSKNQNNINIVLSIIESIGRMIERKFRINGPPQLVVNGEFMVAVINIIKLEADDNETKERIANRIESLYCKNSI